MKLRGAIGACGVLALAAAALTFAPARAAGPVPTFTITQAGPNVEGLESPTDLAEILLGPDMQLVGESEINLSANVIPNVLRSFGRFANGGADLGVEEGLIVTANAFAGSFDDAQFVPNASDNRSSPGSNSPADANALLAVARAGLGNSSATNVNNVTSLSFAVAPPEDRADRYLKFEYSLLITETGQWNTQWSGNVFGYPDGFALLVGDDGTNCATVPLTPTYLSMKSVGIVPPMEDFGEGREVARSRLDDYIRSGGTDDTGFAFTTGELENGAYSPNSSWTVQFLTVPLTCVHEATFASDDTQVPVEIIIGDLNDALIPPAAIFASSSLRWSSNPTPSQDVPLTVVKGGSGVGAVASSPAGISCGANCESTFSIGSLVTLTASPGPRSFFTGWSGACSGSGACIVEMSEARKVTATFTALPPLGEPPGPPSDVEAVPGSGQATVSWTAPWYPGSDTVTGYAVTAFPGGHTCTVSVPYTTPPTPVPTRCIVTGLVNGSSYTFAVRARNSAGWGLPSWPSPPITVAVPGPSPTPAPTPTPPSPPAPTPSPAPTPTPVSIQIVGARIGQSVKVTGKTTGLTVDALVVPYVRTDATSSYRQGEGVPVTASGSFVWNRQVSRGKTLWVYFEAGGQSSTPLRLPPP